MMSFADPYAYQIGTRTIGSRAPEFGVADGRRDCKELDGEDPFRRVWLDDPTDCAGALHPIEVAHNSSHC
jgi:hypothetical protein